MNQHRTSYAIVICALFAVTYALPAAAWPRSGNPCKQMQRDLDRQIDDLKSSQKDELRECARTNGRDSIACLSMKDQQQEELRGMRDYRSSQVAGCRSLGRGTIPFPPVNVGVINSAGDSDYPYYSTRGYCDEYPYNCYPNKHHHDHDKYPHKHYKHGDPPPSGGGAGVKASTTDPGKRPLRSGHVPPGKTPRPTDTAIGGAGRDHATSQVNRGAERADSPSSPSSSAHQSSASDSSGHQAHGRNSDGGGGGGGSYSGSSHASGGGASSHAGSSSSGSSYSGSAHSGASSAGSSSSSGGGSSGGGGSSHSSSSSSGSSASAASSASHDSGGASRDAGGGRPK